MLAIIAITAVFGVGMMADMLSGYDLPDEGAADESEDPASDPSYMPSQAEFASADGLMSLTGDDDDFEGGAEDDTVLGEGGNDVLRGGNGADWLDGGVGNDTLMGGASGDALSGGAGEDYILGGAGEDAVTGGAGDDTIALGDNNDIYDGVGAGNLGFSEAGDDVVRGGAGNDFLRDFDGQDTLLGGLGNDTLNGTHPDSLDEMADVLEGGFGEDVLVGDNGDTLTGGAGTDSFEVAFEFDQDRDAVVIADLDAANEVVTFAASDFGADAVMEWEAAFDPDSGTATILLSGSHTVEGTLVTLDQEPALILQNMTAESVTQLQVTLDYAA
ncbi:hypothetical protein J7382_03235 [Shimia sp. R11_0]|uniref:calcium-binding protein n=1 Tax=Shimia sp. R11_0 TaxID=2821096 RepID=UPI001ADAD721|nr:calcium-binding protein [Shimia sp. R11_0]MBO9476540.1 hypothetical protein [Shimia sp. R11_0]